MIVTCRFYNLAIDYFYSFDVLKILIEKGVLLFHLHIFFISEKQVGEICFCWLIPIANP